MMFSSFLRQLAELAEPTELPVLALPMGQENVLALPAQAAVAGGGAAGRFLQRLVQQHDVRIGGHRHVKHVCGVRPDPEVDFGRLDLDAAIGQHGARLRIEPRPEIGIVPVTAGHLPHGAQVFHRFGGKLFVGVIHFHFSSGWCSSGFALVRVGFAAPDQEPPAQPALPTVPAELAELMVEGMELMVVAEPALPAELAVLVPATTYMDSSSFRATFGSGGIAT